MAIALSAFSFMMLSRLQKTGDTRKEEKVSTHAHSVLNTALVLLFCSGEGDFYKSQPGALNPFPAPTCPEACMALVTTAGLSRDVSCFL